MDKQIVLVIGGPGKSGSTTIAKMLTAYFRIERVYGGELFRNGLKDLYKNTSIEEMKILDKKVDSKLKEYARKGNILIESKTFAGIATNENIQCSAKIWITADLNTRVKRAVEKESITNPLVKWLRRKQIKKDLISRYENDKMRYKELYSIDYDHPEKYNDLVIDNSGQTPDQTFNLIINFLKDAGIKK